jgi:glycosyltransferase involved in cell wall biosynthesis
LGGSFTTLVEKCEAGLAAKYRLRVLVSAFACDPKGESGLGTGEDILGWNLIQQLGRYHELWILASSKNEPHVESLLKASPQPHLHFYFLDGPRWLQKLAGKSKGGIQLYAYLWQIKALFQARRLQRQFHFDVFHQTTYANDWMASYIGAFLPVAYIRGPGGGTHPVPRAFLRGHSLAKMLWEYVRIYGRKFFRLDPVFIIGQRRARALLVCNPEAKEAIPPAWRGKVHLFPVNGMTPRELKHIDSLIITARGRAFTILSVGRLIPLKGFALAIQAFALFSEKCPTAELRIFGEGPERDSLETLARTLRVKERVRFFPWVGRDQILAEMKSCDCFLFPSLYDGGGAVVVEAMAARMPAITLKSGGPGFHIRNAWGILVEPHDPSQAVRDMASALESLWRNPSRRRALGRAARRRVEAFYAWDKLGDYLKKIYDSLDTTSG